uniref:Uncharacterized protein n=1 Tax=Mola mola TaxID=94237 RepID=A0A3Q4B3K9_MOLML
MVYQAIAELPKANRDTLAFLLLHLHNRCSCSSRSLPDIPHIAPFFGTKTRYEEVKPHLLLDALSVNASVLRPPAGERCSPVHLSAVIRHGSRYPTVKNIRRIHRLSEMLRGDASGGSAGWQRDIRGRWENWFSEDMDGERRNPSHLGNVPLKCGKIPEKRRTASSKHRCVSSVEAFQEGLWRRSGDRHVQYRHLVDDELLRFFENCRSYVEGVERNRTALQEVEKFKHGEEMEALRRRTAKKLVCTSVFPADLLEAAFFICSYELSIKSVHSPWCFLFDTDDAKVLEYKTDLKQYWKRSHGHVISGLSSCPLFHHVFRTLDRAGRPRRSTDEPPEPASILVGHAETLLPLLSLLGLYKDKTPPTASNYHTQHARSFRTSLIVPYAANLLFVLYDCQRGPRLQLLVNECPVRFPGLEAEDAPLYRDVRATYRHLLDGCDFHRECEGRAAGRGPNTEL